MRRLRAGEWLAAAGGLGLIASLLLLEWYRPTTGEQALDGLTGFESFSVLDLYLVLVAASGLALAVLQATQRGPALPVGAGVLTVVLAGVGVLLLAYRIANQPGPNEFVEVRAGAWIGLAGAVAVLAGGWLSIRDERVPGEGPPEDVEVRSAPRLTPDAEP
ncbi:MAG: hypothetical protein ACRDPC_02405 [Solirubrobacteraceae bacterium]